jgi:hypothetical protein
MVVDGRSDRRLLAECATVLSEAVVATRGSALGEEISARLRLASAEAFSLSCAAREEVKGETMGELALALT